MIWTPKPNSDRCNYKLKVNSVVIAEDLQGNDFSLSKNEFSACDVYEIQVLPTGVDGNEGIGSSVAFERGNSYFFVKTLRCDNLSNSNCNNLYLKICSYESFLVTLNCLFY